MPDLRSSTVMFRKQPKFCDENEVRLLAQIEMEHLPTDSDGFLLPCPERLEVSVDLSMLVAAIIIGPKVTDQNKQTLLERAHAKVPEARIMRSKFDVRP